MTLTLPRGSRKILSAHFNSDEFDCHCGCPTTYIDQDLIALLEKIRQEIYRPIKIRSGFRCVSYNVITHGKPGSYHLNGKAADIMAPGLPVAELRQTIEKVKNGGQVKQGGIGDAPTFIHIDVRGYPATWQY